MEQIGRYKIISMLGRGAMGVVYLADDPLLHRQVAVKTIDLAINDPSRREFLRGRLLRDARAAAALLHSNIVSIFDVVTDGETDAIIMEYVAGENLSAYLARNTTADVAFTLRIVTAMASALDYTHSRGVIHRDIKPANVMLDVSLTPKITDFGIARITEGATTTMTGAVMGTIEYMAPEQVKGEAIDGRADQFALGVITYRMLTGETLFGDHSLTTLAYKIVHEPAPLVRSRISWLPASMDTVLAKALAKNPSDRYTTCGEFAAALNAALAGVNREDSTLAMPAVAEQAPAKRGVNLLALILGAVALGAAAAGIAVWKPWAPAQQAAPTEQAKVAPMAAATSLPPSLPSATPPGQNPPSPPKTEVMKKPAKAVVKEQAENVVPPKAASPVQQSLPTPVPSPPAAAAEDALDRGREAMKNQDYAAALQAFTKATDLRPNWAQAYHSRGNAYEALGQYDAALRDYDFAIRINPGFFNFYASRAACLVKLQQDDRALADLNQALTLKSEAPVVLSTRAALYMRRNDYQRAQADWTQVIVLEPENVVAYRQRAIARRQLGDRPGARADTAKVAEILLRRGK
jgi:serine/threonine protein kinase/Tfp pilus assembly protein PilF